MLYLPDIIPDVIIFSSLEKFAVKSVLLKSRTGIVTIPLNKPTREH